MSGAGGVPVRVECPNCGERILIIGRMWLGKEFKCPKCAATLRLPKRKGELLVLGLPSLLGLLLLWGIVCYALNTEPSKAIVFEGNPIAGIFFWSTIVLLFIWAGFVGINFKLQVVHLAPSCGNCGSTVTVENAHFCPRCGASMSTGVGGHAARIERMTITMTPQRAPTSEFVGICMVCKRELILGGDYAWCPHCGSPAHRVHLLEYLHVHGQCPVCERHLDEEELRQQLTKDPKQLKGMKVMADAKLRREREEKGENST